jgi:hypothetical protein
MLVILDIRQSQWIVALCTLRSAQRACGTGAERVRHTSVEASIRMRGQVEVHAVASEKLFGAREISGYPERRLKFGRTLIFATNMQNLTHYRIDRRALLDDAMYEMIKSVYMSLNTKFAS